MEQPLQLDDVLRLLQAGHTVLVPMQAAADDLRRHFDLMLQDRQHQAWEPPPLFSWVQWLESLWSPLALDGLEDRVLLNHLQEELLWAELAPVAGMANLPASTLRALARQASSGLSLAAAFRTVDRLASSADSPDSRTFAAWQRAFQAHCQTHRFLSHALLTNVLTEHLHAGHLTLPADLFLVGFERLDPSQKAFLDGLRLHGAKIHHHTLRQPAMPGLLGSCRVPGDPQAELRWAVLWLRQYLQSQPEHLHPAALILPYPERERPLLEPLLREFLAPELIPVNEDLSSTPWHFSNGPALASGTILAHALQLLRWTQGELSIETIGTLLLSPYLAHTDSFEARARFEIQSLRKTVLLRPEMTLAAFLRFAASTTPAKEDSFGRSLSLPEWRDLQTLLTKTSRSSASYGDWAEFARRLLHTVGWPGPRTLSATEFRLTEAWDTALDLMATLDLHGHRTTLSEFLTLLTSELQRTPLQDTNPEAILQILRAPETEGRLFSAALVLRATDDILPAPEFTHPLLGWALQKNLAMPGTNAGSSQELSRTRLKELAARSSVLLLTVADHDASGPLRLTELAEKLSLPTASAESLLQPQPPALSIRAEPFFDEEPLPPLPSFRIAGGARVLELQASCGFRAFASLRLNADVPETRNLGGDARQSGQDLHRALEIFWQGVQSQTALRALTPAARRTAVSAAVSIALEARRRAQPTGDSWTEAYIEVAGRRLTNLILKWLEKELLRGDFTVMQQEEKQLISVGPLELSIRPDRVDKVDGGIAFVDYKTSQALRADDWLGDRPAAPQLPLYALLAEPEEVCGLAFARVRAGKDMGWISLQSDAGPFPQQGGSTVGAFIEQVALWRTELSRLATEFAAGFATVDPKSFPETCEFCQQRLLCRLDPATLLSATDQGSPALPPEQEDDSAR